MNIHIERARRAETSAPLAVRQIDGGRRKGYSAVMWLPTGALGPLSAPIPRKDAANLDEELHCNLWEWTESVWEAHEPTEGDGWPCEGCGGQGEHQRSCTLPIPPHPYAQNGVEAERIRFYHNEVSNLHLGALS